MRFLKRWRHRTAVELPTTVALPPPRCGISRISSSMDNARRQPFVSDTIVKPLVLPRVVDPPAKLSRCDYRATLAKPIIESDLAFMPYPTTPAAQKNRLTHIRCTLCILDTKLDEVTEALGKALTMDYGQRSKNRLSHRNTLECTLLACQLHQGVHRYGWSA